MSTSSDGIPTEMSEDENKTLHRHIDRRLETISTLSDGISKETPVDGNKKLDTPKFTKIGQENMNASPDGTPTEMSVDENVQLDRNNESRYTLDLQCSCKEECGSDYIGGLTIKNKTQPSDTKQLPSVDERKRDSRLTYETNKEDKDTVDLKSIKVVVSDVETIGNIKDEEASTQNLMSIAACSENVLETESRDYPIKRNPNHDSSYHTDSNDHNQTAYADMAPNPQTLETSSSIKHTEHKPAEPLTQESQDMKPINARTDGYLKTTLTLDSSLTDRQQSLVESQPHENQNVNRINFVINVEKSNDVSKTTPNISESPDRNDNNQSSQSTRTTTAQILEKLQSQESPDFDKNQVETRIKNTVDDLNINDDISEKKDCKDYNQIVESGIAHSSPITETSEKQKNTEIKIKTREDKAERELHSSPEQSSACMHTIGQQDKPIPEIKYTYMETQEHKTTMTTRQLAILEFMSKFGLDAVYPQKIALVDVMKIRTQSEEFTLSQLPWMVLENLMMMNSTCRDKMLQEFLERIPKEDDTDEKSKTCVDEEDNWAELSMFDTDKEDTQSNVNPLDLLVAIFICSSQSLRNVLAAKLFMCKLAIPVVVPSAINELTLTNSVFHSVVLDETTPNNLVRQTLAMNCHCHIVSFVRFGRPSISKSKLINTLLSDSNHETFFNENCPLGTSPKTISQGIIEAAWFLPSRETKNFENITMFLNLRGNCQTEQKQLQLLSRLSSVMVILVDLDNLQDTNTQDILHNLQTLVTGGVVLALDAYKYDSRTSKEICQKYSKQIPEQNMKTKLCPLAMNKQNVPVSEVKRILLAQLSSMLKKTDAEPLSTRIVAETDTDYKRNKDSVDLRKAREKATDVLKLIPKEVIDVKKLITPLQGEPWHIWSENSKIINRASKCTSPQERSSYQEEMKKQRQLQLKTVENMHEFMKMTVDTFDEFLNNDQCFGVVTEWMKLMLNDRSRTVTSNCLARYKSDCQALELAKGVNKDISEAEEQVKKSKSNLNSAPFRFEHLMRECGQIFESVETCKSYEDGMSNATEILSTKLPKIAAKLLLLGEPLEILDGDTTHVPLMWVEAVLYQVKQLIHDKKLLSISVVGLQSSGKSTLLNTLFGLQFAVNAGRCTSGVFMQLVPVSKGNSGFDYIVVFDTEGLRSQRYDGTGELRHDNMLATFVIGLGDITIVNVKGENTSEVKDILQIAVHAFLRLKLVNKKLNLKQSCVFIHQNVSDAGAISKMLEERQIFVQSLDEMAKAAAEQEDVADIQTFSQVIDFDCEKNVSYFSDLWLGDPPMAPVNPGYCKRVGEVRNTILNNLASKRKTYLTVTDTITRIKDIWNGILKDDFVYSFRNSLELKAYNEIERVYHGIVWELEKFQYEFVSTVTTGKLSQECIDNLDASVNDSLRTFSSELEAKMNAQRKRLVSFIETSNLTEVMIQWKEMKLKRMNIISENLIIKSKTDMNNIKEEIKAKMIQRKERVKYEKQINELAQKFARNLQGKMPSKEAIKDTFDQRWSIWLNELNFKDIKNSSSVADRIEAMLFEEFQSELGFMHSRGDCSVVKRENLKGSIKSNSILDEHISVRNMLNTDEQEVESIDVYREQAASITDDIFHQIDRRIQELRKLDVRFDNLHVREILNIISANFKDHNEHTSNDYKFNLHSTFRAFIIEHVVRHLVIVFTELDQQYDSKHSPRSQMEEYKHTVWTLFTNLFEQKTEDMITVGFFKDAMLKIVTDHVSTLIPMDVANKVMVSFSREKYTLMKTIMIELARNDNFDAYMAFVKEPVTFTRDWLSDYLYKYIFHNKTHDIHHYGLLAKSRTTKIFETVLTAISETTILLEKKEKVCSSKWINVFVSKMKTYDILPVTEEIFVHVLDRNISDISNFKKVLFEEMNKVENQVNNTFLETTSYNVQWKKDVLGLIMEKLWGCEEKCMFCAEPCMITDKYHVKEGRPHQCIQHRPKGISGFTYEWNKSLVINFCNEIIQTEADYMAYDIDEYKGKSRQYKDYRKHYPDWDIQPTHDTSKYWMYVMCTYQQKLTDRYRRKTLPDIPAIWYGITLEEAINSL